ncbi:hypothetical protein LOZ58_001379 [Ophidiomyces ophidiicola]|nr:hypothetical protein LOZ58_001379 [Ophidiomyces ophidiicola]
MSCLMPSSTSIRVSASAARRFVQTLLEKHQTPTQYAALVAKCLVDADLRGVDSHGINRIPSYIARIRHDVLDPAASPLTRNITPVVAQVDGQNGFGFVAAQAAMEIAIQIGKEFGIGMVSVKHSNHFGMSASFVQQAIDADMLSLVFTNSSAALPVWGGKEKLMGVSPIACGVPAGDDTIPFILDMTPSVAARGKVYKALRRGEQIPPNWALDQDGSQTTDPSSALKGVMLPVGGPKGSALSIMMDVLSGVLSGSAFAGHVTNPYDPSSPADVGHMMVAISPNLFMSLDDFKARMDYLYRRVVGCEKMGGVDRIYYPGEIEQLTARRRMIEGIPYVRAEIEALNREAELAKVARLETLH